MVLETNVLIGSVATHLILSQTPVQSQRTS